MGKPYFEQRQFISQHKPARTAGSPQFGRGVYGWVLFVGVVVLLFFYLQFQNNAESSTARPVQPSGTPTAPRDGVVGVVVVLGFGFVLLGVSRLLRKARQPKAILRWHFDEAGITTETTTSEHMLRWESVNGLIRTADGFLIDTATSGTRLFPDAAFDDEAERQAFIDTFARRGMRSPKAS